MKGFKDVIILLLIAMISGFFLSVVYTATKTAIDQSKAKETEEALREVAPFITEGYTEVQFDYDDEKIPIYVPAGTSGNNGVGIKVTTAEGFAGNIRFLMGVNAGGEITGFRILESSETPGLGSKASDESFWKQFIGKSLETFTFKVKKDGGDADAITASTITSRAVTHALEKGLLIYNAFLQNEVPSTLETNTKILFDYDGEQIPIHVGAAADGDVGIEITTSEGYSGDIRFLMGINIRGEITSFQILESSETPGMGSMASDESFWKQFIGKSLETYTFKAEVDGGDVDVITGSTVTTRAISRGLEKGLHVYQAYRGAK
ncbi:MAG: RnfABCDGE type electron transport complex subunit G [bacterium]